MNKLVLALLLAFVLGPSAMAQSFNGAGRMNPASPTGWSPNPNSYAGTPYANPYYNNGLRNPMYSRYPGAPGVGGGVVYPFGTPYINPVATGNGFYSFNGGGVNANLWRAPSGYYYPWASRNAGFSQTVYVNQSGNNSQAVAKDPPLSLQFTDMGQYLDDAHKNGKVTDIDYRELKLRLKDIQSKERSYRIAGDGYLEDNADAEIRSNLSDFGREMTERIKI